MRKILIIEDEPDIQELLAAYLRDAGYEIVIAGDGVEALAQFQQGAFDMILLDLMLPKIDGFGVCELIRQMEIDDYVTKPFSMPILLQKIRAILRRTAGGMENNRCLHYRDLTLDLDGMEAVLAGRSLDLTTREFELLQALISSPGRVFTREVLLAKLWGYDFFGDERVVDSHIKNLRHKMGTDYIETVRGVGYRAAKENS